MSEFETVAKVGDIAPGTGEAFEFHDQMVAIFLEQDGTYLAIDDLCPHMGASLASGHLEGGVVTCPWHAWSFDARDGSWCDNRRLKIDTFMVRVQGDDIQLAAIPKAENDQAGSPLGGGASYGGRVENLKPESKCSLEGNSNCESKSEDAADE